MDGRIRLYCNEAKGVGFVLRRTLCLLLGAALLLPCLCGAARAEEPVDIDAPSAILIDAATGTVLYEKNADESLPPASVTKIMTLLLVMEALDAGKISMEDTVTASDTAAAKGGSQVYLEAGEQMPMDEMLKAVVVSSANDCATALAEHVAGSERAFVAQMNEKAASLGMTNTHFVNCTGLDDEADADAHRTTARDIAIMSRALLQHERIRDYTTIWMDTVRNGQFGLSNTNKLVRFYQGTTGLKTGYTAKAGHCLSASAARDGIELIAVVLHCSSSQSRFTSAKALLDYGFANYALVTPDEDVTLAPISVRLGTQDSLTPTLQCSDKILIDKAQQAQITRSVTQLSEVDAPVAAGQRLGTLTIYAGDAVLQEIPIVSPQEIEKLSFWDVAYRLFRCVCIG